MWTRAWSRRALQKLYQGLTGHTHPARIGAANVADLTRQLVFLNVPVPPRHRRSRNDQDAKEWYVLRRYLLPLAHADALGFPLEVVKAESPDFLLHDGHGRTTGVEVTEATTAAFQRELTQSEGRGGVSPHDEAGWVGDEVEAGLAGLVAAVVEKKLARMAGNHWRPADRQELLVYDNSPYLGAHVESLRTHLRATLAGVSALHGPSGAAGPVASVSLVTGNTLLYDAAGVARVLAYDPAWD